MRFDRGCRVLTPRSGLFRSHSIARCEMTACDHQRADAGRSVIRHAEFDSADSLVGDSRVCRRKASGLFGVSEE